MVGITRSKVIGIFFPHVIATTWKCVVITGTWAQNALTCTNAPKTQTAPGHNTRRTCTDFHYWGIPWHLSAVDLASGIQAGGRAEMQPLTVYLANSETLAALAVFRQPSCHQARKSSLPSSGIRSGIWSDMRPGQSQSKHQMRQQLPNQTTSFDPPSRHAAGN